MRSFSALALIALLVGSCTPYIPVKDAFGVSAQQPVGTIPPEFAEFNNYNPQAALLLATQLCATPYEVQVDKSLPAAPGEIVYARGRCQTYPNPLGNLTRRVNP